MRTSLCDLIKLQSFVIFSMALLVCVGCGTPKESPTQPSPPPTSPVDQNASLEFQSIQHAQQSLVGVWMGKAVLNQQTLQSLMADMTPSQQEKLTREATTFASTQIAMQLDDNGVLQTAVHITPAGAQPIQGQTTARWSVTHAQGNQVVVQTVQQNESEPVKTTQTVYVVSPDGNRIVMQANVGDVLSKCEPLVFLDRQIQTRAANATVTSDASTR